MLRPSMRAIEITQPGGPEMLALAQRPVPAPGPGEVLIRVHASGLNGADLVQRRGHYPPPEGASDLPGLEVSGEIAALGRGVTTLAIGDRVVALLAGGGYAEYCTAPAGQVLPLPSSLDWVAGAGLIETLATVWFNLFMKAGLHKGQRLLVHGGASGIGTTAIQLACLFGAEVFCTVSSKEKADLTTKLGARRAINYRKENFAETIRAETGDGVDHVLDIIGQPYLADNLKCLRKGGRLTVIAYAGGRIGELDLARVMMKELTVTGSILRSQPLARKVEILADLHAKIWPMIEDGRFAPVIDHTFPLENAADAHRHMESGTHMGKVVLTND